MPAPTSVDYNQLPPENVISCHQQKYGDPLKPTTGTKEKLRLFLLQHFTVEICVQRRLLSDETHLLPLIQQLFADQQIGLQHQIL